MFLTNLERHTDLECVYIRERCINCTKQYNEGVSQKKIKKLQPSASNGPLDGLDGGKSPEEKKGKNARAPPVFRANRFWGLRHSPHAPHMGT